MGAPGTPEPRTSATNGTNAAQTWRNGHQLRRRRRAGPPVLSLVGLAGGEETSNQGLWSSDSSPGGGRRHVRGSGSARPRPAAAGRSTAATRGSSSRDRPGRAGSPTSGGGASGRPAPHPRESNHGPSRRSLGRPSAKPFIPARLKLGSPWLEGAAGLPAWAAPRAGSVDPTRGCSSPPRLMAVRARTGTPNRCLKSAGRPVPGPVGIGPAPALTWVSTGRRCPLVTRGCRSFAAPARLAACSKGVRSATVGWLLALGFLG
jgi:hypothetical protein